MRARDAFTVYLEGGERKQFCPFETDQQLELVRNVIRAIREEEPVQASIYDGRLALATSWAALESIKRNGESIPVNRGRTQ